MGNKDGARNRERLYGPNYQKRIARRGGKVTGEYIVIGKKYKKGELNNPL